MRKRKTAWGSLHLALSQKALMPMSIVPCCHKPQNLNLKALQWSFASVLSATEEQGRRTGRAAASGVHALAAKGLLACMLAWMHVHMLACMYVCTYVRKYVCKHVCMYVCMYIRMSVSMYVRTYVCVHACIYVRMYVRLHVYLYLFIHINRCRLFLYI